MQSPELDELITKPPHYTHGRIEVWDFVDAQELDFCEGNVVKYVCRYKHKGTPLQDLQKAMAYLQRLLERYEP